MFGTNLHDIVYHQSSCKVYLQALQTKIWNVVVYSLLYDIE